MGYNPQQSLENTIHTMGTRTLGVHPSLSFDETSHNFRKKKYKKHSFEPLGLIYGLDSILPLAFRKKSSQIIPTEFNKLIYTKWR